MKKKLNLVMFTSVFLICFFVYNSLVLGADSYEPNDDQYQARPLVVDSSWETINFEINPASDQDWFMWDSSPGDMITINLLDLNVSGFVRFVIISDDKQLIVPKSLYNTGGDNTYSYEIPCEGTYYLKVTGEGYSLNGGSFKVKIDDKNRCEDCVDDDYEPNDEMNFASSLEIIDSEQSSEVVFLSVGKNSDIDIFEIVLSPDNEYHLNLTDVRGSLNFLVMSEDETQFMSGSVQGEDGDYNGEPFYVSTEAKYYIKFFSDSLGSANMKLEWESTECYDITEPNDSPEDAKKLNMLGFADIFQDPDCKRIFPAEDMDYFYFRASGSLTYTFTISEVKSSDQKGRIALYIYDQDKSLRYSGPHYFNAGDEEKSIEFCAPVSKTKYLLLIEGDNSRTFTYMLKAVGDTMTYLIDGGDSLGASNSSKNSADPMIINAPTTYREINPKGDVDWYSFYGAGGENYFLTTELMDDSLSYSSLSVRIEDKNGYTVQVTPTYEGTTAKYSLQMAIDSEYFIKVSANREIAYRIKLIETHDSETIGGSRTLSYPVQLSGVNEGQYVINKGDRLTINALSASDDNLFWKLGDGNRAQGTSVTNIYADPGTYIGSVYSLDENGQPITPTPFMVNVVDMALVADNTAIPGRPTVVKAQIVPTFIAERCNIIWKITDADIVADEENSSEMFRTALFTPDCPIDETTRMTITAKISYDIFSTEKTAVVWADPLDKDIYPDGCWQECLLVNTNDVLEISIDSEPVGLGVSSSCRDDEISYSMDIDDIIEIDDKGNVTPLNVGEVKVTAISAIGGNKSIVTVIVYGKVSLPYESVSLNMLEEKTITPIANGVDLMYEASSSDPDAVSVESDGLLITIKGVQPGGEAEITIIGNNTGEQGKAVLHVTVSEKEWIMLTDPIKSGSVYSATMYIAEESLGQMAEVYFLLALKDGSLYFLDQGGSEWVLYSGGNFLAYMVGEISSDGIYVEFPASLVDSQGIYLYYAYGLLPDPLADLVDGEKYDYIEIDGGL